MGILEGFLTLSENMIFWNVITFAILVFVLGKYGWKPILSALDARMNTIKSDIDQAETNKAESQSLIESQKQMLNKARGEAQDIVNNAKADATVIKDETIVKTRSEVQELMDNARKEVEIAKTQAIDQVKNEMGQLSVDIAGTIIAKTLKPKDHEELILKALSNYQGLK